MGLRSFQTFSSSPYFEDRGPNGCAQPITERVNPHSRPIVSYYFPKGVGEHHYGEIHPMKPHRLTLTNALVMGYGLDKQIHHIYNPTPATRAELEVYHDPDYINFLSRVKPQNQNEYARAIDVFNCTDDCPIFADMFDFCRMYTGASLAAARKLCSGTTDIAINWSGGLHHAKRGEASGFCYLNDIVLAILEMLKYYPRVLYIDIDIHHGDGVEQAFYQTNRVMTLSFHKYTGDFFPGTGKLHDNGMGVGKHFALNVPLLDGITDDLYVNLFKQVVEATVTAFRPAAIVLQCGADSLGCDRLGAFNLSIKAHAACVDHVRAYAVPLLVLGGGGYTIRNVSRCWTYETAVLVGAALPDELPRTVYDHFFRESAYKLHPPLTGRVDNQNSRASVQRTADACVAKLRYLQGAPSVEMQELPPDLAGWLDVETGERDRTADAAPDRRAADRTVLRNEYFSGENDVDQDDVVPVARGRGRGRGGARRARGRPRGSGRGASTAVAREDGEEDASDAPTPAKRPRGRPRGRGRGRGRGRAKSSVMVDDRDDLPSKEASPEPEAIAEGSAHPGQPGVQPMGDVSSHTPSKGAPMDVDVE